MEHWNIDAVCEFLYRNDFEEDIVETFRVNRISGKVLSLLSEDDLKELGLCSLEDQKHFHRALRKAQKEKDTGIKTFLDHSSIDYETDFSDDDYFVETKLKKVKLDQNSCTISSCLDSVDLKQQQPDDTLSFPCKFQQQSSSPLYIPLEQNQPESSISIQFEMLNFRQRVSSSLKEQQLFGLARANFITTIAKAIYQTKCHPTREEYECIATQIISKWSFLNEQIGHNLLVQSLMTRMRALRSQIGSVKPTIGWKRGTPRTNRKQPHLMPASPAFIPDFSESREMHDTRVEMLQLVCKSDHPSKKVILDFMERTFQFRRCDVLERKFQLKDLLLAYPPLKDPDELGHELNRIMGSDVVSYINHTWKILCPKIVAIGKDEGSGKQHVNELMCGLPSNIPDGDLQVFGLCLLYYLVPDATVKVDLAKIVTIMKEDDNVQLVLTQLPTTQPCVIMKGTLGEGIKEASLVVQNQIITTFEPRNSVTVLMSAFCAYNMHYPDGCFDFYTALEVLFLRQRYPPPRKTKLTAVLNKLTYSNCSPC